MNSRSTTLVAICGLVAMFLAPTPATASMIDFTGLGHASQVSVGGVRTGTFWAGELNWRWEGAAPEGFAQTFYSYCIDVTQNLQSNDQVVSVRSSDGFSQHTSPSDNRPADGGSKAAFLFNSFASDIRKSNGSAANINAAALQLAIWESIYDTSQNLAGGNFRVTGSTLTGQIRTQADIYLGALYSHIGGWMESRATVLDVVSPNRGQDQITHRVSEPSSMALIGVALFVWARSNRRTRLETLQN